MRDREHQQLLSDVRELRELLAAHSTHQIAGTCFAYWLRRDSLEDDFGLLSAARQWQFLLGLMLGTPEPSTSLPFDQSAVQRACNLLNGIFSAYAWAYWPQHGEEVTAEWRRTREVAMPAFLAYVNQGLMASTQQVENRIRSYLSPFDWQLQDEVGLDASMAADICRAITERLQNAADSLAVTARRERKARLALLERANREQWESNRLRSEAQAPEYQQLASELFGGLEGLGIVSKAWLIEQFGADAATAFWNRFSAKRGEGHVLTYPTESNIAATRSLYAISEDRAMCPLANHLFQSVLLSFEQHLSSGLHRERFLRHRDEQLEADVEASFKSLLGRDATIYRGLSETRDQQFEHDLVLRVARSVIVVEAKASPPVEPFRDPDKAYIRIRDAFRSNRGLQHAFGQGRRILRIWSSGAPVQLYDKHGRLTCEFDRTEVDEVLLIAATRDSFGILATDLSLLLEKEAEDPYPWAVNAIDLDAIAGAWKYFGWGADKFLDFLRARIQLHGRILCSDELETAGFFIQHGGLDSILDQPADRIWLNPAYSTVFDDIYKSRVAGGPKVVFAPQPVKWASPEDVFCPQPDAHTRARPQGRNEPCACGSGKKYKRCHGK